MVSLPIFHEIVSTSKGGQVAPQDDWHNIAIALIIRVKTYYCQRATDDVVLNLLSCSPAPATIASGIPQTEIPEGPEAV
jgi:hypothetical protein